MSADITGQKDNKELSILVKSIFFGQHSSEEVFELADPALVGSSLIISKNLLDKFYFLGIFMRPKFIGTVDSVDTAWSESEQCEKA